MGMVFMAGGKKLYNSENCIQNGSFQNRLVILK